MKIKILTETARMPTYATDGSACFDLYADNALLVKAGKSAVVDTGVAFEVPMGHVMKVYSRSGHGFKNGIRLSNAVGIVDADFRGSVKVCLHNDSDTDFAVHAGDRIAQAMVETVFRHRLEVVDKLSTTVRGEGGFGSSGA